MITETRLEELIKEEATIYNAEPYNRLTGVPTTRVIKLNKDNYIDCCDNLINKIVIEKVYFEKEYREMAYNEIINIQYLFETKAETDFYEKYGNIKRVEKMPVPPTWEEVVKNKIEIIDNNKIFIVIDFPLDFNKDCGIIVVFTNRNNKLYCEMSAKFNEVNYYKALDKMVELWKEEV